MLAPITLTYQSVHVDSQITGEAQEEQNELQDDDLACACERTQPVHFAERVDEEDKDGAMYNGEQ